MERKKINLYQKYMCTSTNKLMLQDTQTDTRDTQMRTKVWQTLSDLADILSVPVLAIFLTVGNDFW
jgi:hypothetical protein